LAAKAVAPTAEALMRSRYTAHVRLDTGYILRTTHPSTRGRHDERKTRAWAESLMWKRLDILDRQKGQASDETGVVEFQAWYIDDLGLQCLRERSNFKQEFGMWFYVDGVHIGRPKLEGHQICPCGSGERYQDCCGA
jgi:SEC-C motif-containing protein